jgi:hypothetical protein
MEKIDFNFLVNDKMDVLVRIRSKNDFSKWKNVYSRMKDTADETVENTIYYYETADYIFADQKG